MPPSAITGVPLSRATFAASMMAVSCGTPTPATMRVVQIEPGPMPILIASAPASISALRAVARRDVAGDDLDGVRGALDAPDGVQHLLGMAVRRVDDDDVDAGIDQQLGAREARLPHGRRRGDAQPPLLVLAGIGMERRLLDVLDGHQPDAAILVVDDDELLDAVMVEKALRLVLRDALA